jgi:hypothetical protein
MRKLMDSGWRRRIPQRFPVHYAIVIRRGHDVVETGLLSDLGLQDAWGSAAVPLLVGEGCVLRFALWPDKPFLSFPAFIRAVRGQHFRAQLACPDARATHALVEWISEKRRAQESDSALMMRPLRGVIAAPAACETGSGVANRAVRQRP